MYGYLSHTVTRAHLALFNPECCFYVYQLYLDFYTVIIGSTVRFDRIWVCATEAEL